jgi:hypothetical protein
LAVGSAQAVTTYAYTGNFFNVFATNDPPAGDYDATMRVTGFFSLADPLAPNLINQNIVPDLLGFSFSDGRQTLTSADATPTLFSVSTDPAGTITGWGITVEKGNVPFDSQNPAAYFGIDTRSSLTDSGKIDVCAVEAGGICSDRNDDVGGRFLAPGIWSVSESAVPLPAALPLFAAGLGALGLIGWRRKRNAAASP